MKFISVLICSMLIAVSLSGCIWGPVAVVGVAVVGANVDEYQRAKKARNSTEALEEHLAHQRDVDQALAGESGCSDPVNADKVIETYTEKDF